jgi:hypothetical protein
LDARFEIPDGYAADFRRAINLEIVKINGLKSHDYHIFIERLLPVMLHRYLNDDVWMTIAELSHFYRQLCAKEIKKEMMEKMEKNLRSRMVPSNATFNCTSSI